MKLVTKLGMASAFAIAALTASAASATSYVYVGSWSPYNAAAPNWGDQPLAYTGQEAAALLFGGSAGDYAISTVDSSVANINNSAWYDVIGVGGNVFAQDYNNKYLGLYYGPVSGYNCCGAAYKDINAASAFVRDNFVTSVNYAFRAVPEPATWGMMIVGFGLVGAGMRRRAYRTA
jgi:hypothetical protein